MGLTPKIAVRGVAILIFALGILFIIANYKFQKIHGSIVESRYAAIATSLSDGIESGLRLGLPLAEFRGAQTLVDRMMLQEGKIDAVLIYDLKGTILYASDPTRIGGQVADQWVSGLPTSTEQAWRLDDGDTLVTGTVVEDALGYPVAGMAVIYSKRYQQSEAEMVTNRLLVTGGVVLSAATMAMIILTWLLLGRVRRNFRGLAQCLRTHDATPKLAGFGEAAEGFQSSYGDAVREVEALEANIRAAGLPITRGDAAR